MQYTEQLKTIDWLTYNVARLEIVRPSGFTYQAGDAVEIRVGNEEPGPFTMTNLPGSDVLEFMIRIYKDHHGKTEAISNLRVGDKVSFTAPFNTFNPQERAVFLAGGTGITPFVAIMRAMYQAGTLDDCLLIFSNKSRQELFLEEELKRMLGSRYYNVITQDVNDPEYYGTIDEAYLRSHLGDFSRPILVCGPPPFDEAMEKILGKIGIASEGISLSS